MKLTELIKQIIKESINELSDTSSDVSKFLDYAKNKFTNAKDPKFKFLDLPSYKALHDYIEAASGKDFDELRKELTALDPNWNKKEETDEAFFIGENKTIECGKCGWRWDLEDGGDNPYLCHKCDYDNSYRYNDEIEEYDVDENNLYEVKDFIKFMKEYKTFLAEASCDCVMEAEYHGRNVQLGKPMQGDIKKFKVYVKNNKGKVVKVNFGAHGMNIKRNNPKRRNAYRKRHNCDNPGPRWKANYWSCRKW